MSLRVLIVDDESLARERIRSLLATDAGIEIVGECASGEAAVRAICDRGPDLVFLDVQMPGMDGFETLAAAAAARSGETPAVIFVTAYDQHALRAFEVHAQDYLLKPFDRERFTAALERAKAARARGGDVAARLAELLADQERARRTVRRLVIHTAGRVLFLAVSEVDWIESAGNYVRIHAGAEAHLYRETMRDLEAKLDPDEFLRIHRSTIVRIERIRELRPWFHGAFVVVLRDGTELQSSRGFSEKLRSRFGSLG
ncbi:MAG: LytR/AlgR family response regulator transcription factor [bacterium]